MKANLKLAQEIILSPGHTVIWPWQFLFSIITLFRISNLDSYLFVYFIKIATPLFEFYQKDKQFKRGAWQAGYGISEDVCILCIRWVGKGWVGNPDSYRMLCRLCF